MSATTSLSWDETLAELLGLLGSPASVTLVDGQSGAIVAAMRGTLATGVDLSDAEDGSALYLSFEHDRGCGVVLTRTSFRGAAVLDDGALAVEQGGLGLIVELCPSFPA